MPTSGLRKTLEHLRQTLVPGELADEELLKRFIVHRDQTAFTTLVRRHGPMVMGVSRRILGSSHDSEDVFQATFLVLVQKARSVVNRRAIAGWLYTVAYRTAVEARARNARRRQKEAQVKRMPQPEVAISEVQDWQPVLDSELDRLPEKYRLPIILCDLEGRSRKEVARRLRVREGTLSSRLATGRRMLAERLTRRGVILSGGALATAMSAGIASAAVRPELLGATTKAAVLVAAGHFPAVSSSVLSLMKIGAKAMFIAKLKATVATVVILGLVGAGGLSTPGAAVRGGPRASLKGCERKTSCSKSISGHCSKGYRRWKSKWVVQVPQSGTRFAWRLPLLESRWS